MRAARGLAKVGGALVALAALAALFAPAPPSVARTGLRADGHPVLRATNTITATGLKGIEVVLPDTGRQPRLRQDIEISMRGGTFAYFGLNEEPCLNPDKEMCLLNVALLVPGYSKHTISWVGTPRLRPGPYEIYIATDGAVAVTFRIRGLSGKLRAAATGRIKAALRELPRECSETGGDCEHFGHGGLMRVGGTGGFAASIAYAEVNGRLTPDTSNPVSSDSVAACVYPSSIYPTSSPDPEDHPQGCDVVPTGEDKNTFVNFTGRAADALTTAYLIFFGTEGSGPRYAGYIAEQFSPTVPVGSYGAWGLWFDQGIKCPSGDFIAGCQITRGR